MSNKDEFQEYLEKYGQAYLDQLDLEKAHKEEAEAFLQRSFEKALQENDAYSTSMGRKLIDYTWESCRKNIQALMEAESKPKRGVKALYSPLLHQLATLYGDTEKGKQELENLLTLASLTEALNACLNGSNKTDISRIAYAIAVHVEEEANIAAYLMQHPEKTREMSVKLNQRIRYSYRRMFALTWLKIDGWTLIQWKKEQRIHLGAKLLDTIIAGSGFFTLSKVSRKGASITCLQPSEWLVQTWEKNREIALSFAHRFTPTIIPPKPWDNPYNGGYYGDHQQFTSLVRLQNGMDTKLIRDYQKRLNQVDLSCIYKALNALQATPFRINKQMLTVCQQLKNQGGGMGIPTMEPAARLPHLPEPYTPAELEEHKKKQVKIIQRNNSLMGKKLRAISILAEADRYKDYAKIYFPWNMDYRGRCYPMSATLSPQGDDLAKSLLSFAEPAPCKSTEDKNWLMLHGANLAGKDKLPFTERIAWVDAHREQILNSAKDPLGYRWWFEVSEDDYPLEFLAFCFEWKRMEEWCSSSPSGTIKGFRCQIPIAFDGSCSGLQHFSALLRDEVGGKAVNLTPSPTMQDIYGIVAAKVNIVLKRDTMQGTADDVKKDEAGTPITDAQGKEQPMYGTKFLAQTWINFARETLGQEGITRKICKRSVMTLAYGSGLYGFRDNLLEDFLHPYTTNNPNQAIFRDNSHAWQAAQYMAALIWDAVANTVVKAVEGMKWLQKAAAATTKKKHVITWITPNGLPVQQNYINEIRSVFEMRIAGRKKRFYYLSTDDSAKNIKDTKEKKAQKKAGDIDKKKQCQGISPNFIHSMDACHMQRVILAATAKGIMNFEMVHDSFGTDLANAALLFQIIREEFVALYEGQDHLQAFLDGLSDLLDEKTKKALEESKPSFGKLDIKDVMKSDFCFA